MSRVVTLPAPETTGAAYFDLAAAQAALEGGAPVTFPPFELVRARIGGVDLTFCCNYEQDPIQKSHRQGQFYEAEDLAKISQYLPESARVLDVGANVGNHAMYFATQAGASQVIVIEPNPLALAPLLGNVVVNDLRDVIRLDALGVGLGACSEAGLSMKRHDRNLGATKMKRGLGGALEVHPGDALFEGEEFDLIKIDVEGMEMEVLSGLEATILRCKPLLFIEVDDKNAADFAGWMTDHAYAPLFTSSHSATNTNILLTPMESTP